MSEKITSYSTFVAVIAVVCTTLFWGGNSVAGRMSVGEIPPISFAFWRWLLALAILLPFTARDLWTHRAVLQQYKWKLVILAIPSITVFNTMVYLSASTTPAVNISLIQTALPLFTILLSIVLLGIWPHGLQLLGMAIAFAGLLTIISRGDLSVLASLQVGTGECLMLFATLCWSFYTVLLNRFKIPVTGASLLTILVTIGVTLLLPFYLMELKQVGGFALTLPRAGLLVYVSLFASVLAYTFWIIGTHTLGSNNIAMFNYLIPVFAAVLAWLILGEKLYAYHIAGAGLIFGGLWLAVRKRDTNQGTT